MKGLLTYLWHDDLMDELGAESIIYELKSLFPGVDSNE